MQNGYAGTKLPMPLRFLRRSSSLNSAVVNEKPADAPAVPQVSSPRSKARSPTRRPRPPLPTCPPLPSAARRLLGSKGSAGSAGSVARASSLGTGGADRVLNASHGRSKSEGLEVETEKAGQEEKISAAWSGRARPGPPLPGLRALSGGNPSRTSATREKAAGSTLDCTDSTNAAIPGFPAPPLPPLDRIPTSLPEHVLEARSAPGRVGITGSPFQLFHQMRQHRDRRVASEPPGEGAPSTEGTSTSSKCRPRADPVGLYNLGNTCFLNAAVQSLAHAPLLADFFLKQHFVKDLNVENPLGTKGAIASAFAKLLQELRTDGEGPARGAVAPKELLLALCKHCPIIAEQPGMQQDAQEVMAFLLDALHEDLNRIRQRLPAAPRSVLADDLQKPEERLAAEAWFDHLQRHRSLVVDLCQGQLRSQVKCCECGCASVTFDPFLFLTLPLPSRLKRGQKVHIEEAIKAFCVEEKLDGTDAWRCPRCERRVSAAKRLSLWKLPLLLLVHLKRFGFEASAGGWSSPSWKIEGEVWTPPCLDLGDFVSKMSPQRASLQYDLFAAVDHAGVSPFSGHYTASCRRPDGWWRFDDANTEYLGRAGSEDTERKVIGPWNYLLLFQRRDAPSEPEEIPEQSHRRPELWPHVLDGAEEWSFMGDSIGSR